MLKYRVISGVLMGACLLAAALFLPPVGAAALVVVIVLPALWEFHRFLVGAGLAHFKWLYLLGGLLFVGLTSFGLLYTEPAAVADLQMLLIVALVTAILLEALARPDTRPFEGAGSTLLALAYVPLLFSYIPRLLFSWGGGDGRLLVLYMIVVVKFSDIGAFFVGSALGRHKLFPRISPAKTWEGMFGGLVVATVASLVFWASFRGDFGVLVLPIGHAVALGLILALSGMLGDLVESMFKRAAGVKDSGASIRGMGGVLDVYDSLLLAAPVLYVYVRIFL